MGAKWGEVLRATADCWKEWRYSNINHLACRIQIPPPTWSRPLSGGLPVSSAEWPRRGQGCAAGLEWSRLGRPLGGAYSKLKRSKKILRVCRGEGLYHCQRFLHVPRRTSYPFWAPLACTSFSPSYACSLLYVYVCSDCLNPLPSPYSVPISVLNLTLRSGSVPRVHVTSRSDLFAVPRP